MSDSKIIWKINFNSDLEFKTAEEPSPNKKQKSVYQDELYV